MISQVQTDMIQTLFMAVFLFFAVMDAAYATSSYPPQPQFDGPRAGPFSAALFFGGIGIATTCITLTVRYKERHPHRIKYLIGFAGMSLLLSAVVFFASATPARFN